MSSATLKSRLVAGLPRFLRPHWERLEASPLGYRLVKGAFWSLAGTLISRALGLLSSILVARMLGKIGFGELGIIQSSVGMFGTFAGFGLGLTATKYVAELRVKDPARAGRIIRLSSLVSWATGGAITVLLFVLAPWLATHTLAAPHLGGLLRLGSLLLLLGAINGAQTGALAGFEGFRRIAHINLATGIATFPLMVIGTWWRGLEGALLGIVASQALNCWLNFHGLRKEADVAGVPLSCAGSAEEWSVLWRFSLPALASSLLVGPVYWMSNAMLVNRPDGYVQMGLFNATNQWFGALLFLPGILGQAALPVLSERMGANDGDKSRKVLAFYIKLNAVVVMPLVLLGCLASPLIMASYGSGFREAWPTLTIVLITAGLLAILTPVGQIIAASGRMWLGSVMNLGWASCFILFTWLLLPRGALGLAGARLLAYLAHSLWVLFFTYQVLRKGSKMVLDRDNSAQTRSLGKALK
jgi:O-antigen/teichoic acid export membrane protein